MESKRARYNQTEVVLEYEELREWEGTIMKKDLMLPFKIESYHYEPRNYPKNMTMDPSGLFEYQKYELLTHFVKLPTGGMLPPNCAFFDEFKSDSIKVSCLTGECGLIIGEADFDGKLKGRRATLKILAGQSFILQTGHIWFNKIWTTVNVLDEPCVLFFDQTTAYDSDMSAINKSHLDGKRVLELGDLFNRDSVLSIPDYFKRMDRIHQELLIVKTEEMEIVSPMNVRRFYWLKPTREQPILQSLIDTLQSQSFMEYLTELTSMPIAGLFQPARLRVLKADCYQILHDDFMEPEGVDVFICLSLRECDKFKAEWTFVAEKDGEVVASFPFDSVNTMHFAFRSGGCARFIRYISKQSDFEAVILSATYKVGDDDTFYNVQ